MSEQINYFLFENQMTVFYNSDFDIVVHELLSYVLGRIQLLIKCRVEITQNCFDDIVINKVHCIPYKRYPVVSDTIKFDLSTQSVVNSIGKECTVVYSDVLESIHEQFKQIEREKLEKRMRELMALKRMKENEKAKKLITVEQSIDQSDEQSIDLPSLQINEQPIKDTQPSVETVEQEKPKKVQISDIHQVFESQHSIYEDCDSEVNRESEYDIDSTNVLSELSSDLDDVIDSVLDNEKRKEFEASRNSYQLIKRDIADKKMNESQIAPFFKEKYNILKFMDTHGNLFSDEGLEVYSTLVEQIENPVNTESEFAQMFNNNDQHK